MIMQNDYAKFMQIDYAKWLCKMIMQNDYASPKKSKSEKNAREGVIPDYFLALERSCRWSREVLARVEAPCTASQVQHLPKH